MQLKLEELQRIVKSTVDEEKKSQTLKMEISKAIGCKVVTTHGLSVMAESANKQLDILERTGKVVPTVKTSILLRYADSKDLEVRKLIARLLPEHHAKNMMFDVNEGVRSVLAQRLPLNLVSKMVKKFPSDDNIFSIYSTRKIEESKKKDSDEFDIYGDVVLGSVLNGVEHPGFTDEWYNTMAHKIINGPTAYGNNLEGNWEEKTVNSICNSYQSQGLDIDHEKLLKAVYDHMDVRDNAAIQASQARIGQSSGDVDESYFRNLASRIRLEENGSTVVMPIISEKIDLVQQLMSAKYSSQAYIQKFESLFCVKKEPVQNVGKKLRINENYSKVIAPTRALLPYRQLRSLDEKALNTYIKSWNNQRRLMEQPYKLSWSPASDNEILFHLEMV